MDRQSLASLFSATGMVRRHLRRFPEAVVNRGMHPSLLGYRWIAKETVPAYFQRREADSSRWAGEYEVIHPQSAASNPLPCNVASAEELPADRGWWGYSFRDVPNRVSGETFLATIPDCTLAFYTDRQNEFYPAIVNQDCRALSLREVVFRPGHGRFLRSSGPPMEMDKAAWFIERVYHNHSHWLTAHLPKLCVLKARKLLDNLLLPPQRSAALDESLRMVGIDPSQCRVFDPSRPLRVRELTLMGTDRFRPELLRLVRDAIRTPRSSAAYRRVFISRAKSTWRRLVNESEVWPVLEDAGFERFVMEELTFADQVRLMSETAVLVAPHGAGLTNMLFCAPGTHVVEIADLSFPNPNFYALASALGLHYWITRGEHLGNAHALKQDLRVDPAAVARVIAQVDAWN